MLKIKFKFKSDTKKKCSNLFNKRERIVMKQKRTRIPFFPSKKNKVKKQGKKKCKISHSLRLM
jgi:hypothetical protein